MSEPVHTFGCAWAQRGGVCDCPAQSEWLRQWSEAVAVETRGIDYSLLVQGLPEGVYDGEEP